MRRVAIFIVAGLLAAGLGVPGSVQVALAKCPPEGEAFPSRFYEQGGAFRAGDTITASFRVRDSGCRNGEHYVEAVFGIDAIASLHQSQDGPAITTVPVMPGDSPGQYVARLLVPADGSWWWIRVLVNGEQIKDAGGTDLLLWGVKGSQESSIESQPHARQGQSSAQAIMLLASTLGTATFLLAVVATLVLRRKSGAAALRIWWPARSRRFRT